MSGVKSWRKWSARGLRQRGQSEAVAGSEKAGDALSSGVGHGKITAAGWRRLRVCYWQ